MVKKDEQIAELRDRLALLTENNERLVNELNEQSKSEIALKRTIEQVNNPQFIKGPLSLSSLRMPGQHQCP